MINDNRSILAENISKIFKDQKALDQVSLTVPSGQIFGFLGPNGAGKTTLVKILATIAEPTAGQAKVGGFDIIHDQSKIRKIIGVALQEVGLDPLMTARELLTLQARLFRLNNDEAKKRAEELLKKVKLDNIDPKKKLGKYSGGMKRRLDLALALVHRPKILFLDEPTTGLDPASRMDIWEEIRRLNREDGLTIFLTTQYLEEADRLANEVAIINNGKIAIKGRPGDLKKKVGQEVLTLSFATPEIAQTAYRTILALCPHVQASGHDLLCYTENAADKIPSAIRLFDQKNIAVSAIKINQPSLDDVFLQVTGDRLEKNNKPL
jgi:ABC-2 type transport system ATP-binding protein